MKHIFLFAGFISVAASAQPIQNFNLTNAVDGKEVSLSTYSSAPGVIIIFTSNECPFDQYYLDRIRSLINSYSSRLPVLLINSHTDEEESVESMKTYAGQCSLNAPYLADKEQRVLNQLNAKKSPEAFVLKNSGGNFSIFYRGAIDDNAQASAEVNQTYVKSAIEKLLAGQRPEVPETRPVGCSIHRI